MQLVQTFNRSARRIRNRSLGLDAPQGLAVQVNSIEELLSSGGSSTVEKADGTFSRHVNSSYRWSGRVLVSGVTETPVFESLDPDIGTVDQYGVVTRVGSGLARILYTTGGFTGRALVACGQSDSGTVDIFTGWVADTFGERCTTYLDGLLAGKNPATDKALFTTQNHGTKTYVRNPSCWLAEVAAGLTCISPWNSAGGVLQAGTAVTDQHIVLAPHFIYGLGTIVRFVDEYGNVAERSVVGRAIHPDYVPYYPDLAICTLNAPLPESIVPCKVLPPNWGNYLVNYVPGRLPCFVLDQEEKASARDVDFLADPISFRKPVNAQRLAFYEDIIPGDSGNPAFILADDGTLILTTVFTYGDAGSGTSVAAFREDLNAMIAAADAQAGLDTGREVETYDLSGYPDFS